MPRTLQSRADSVNRGRSCWPLLACGRPGTRDTRHTAAIFLLVRSVSDRAAMDVMRWSKADMATGYMHVPNEVWHWIARQIGDLSRSSEDEGPSQSVTAHGSTSTSRFISSSTSGAVSVSVSVSEWRIQTTPTTR